MSHKSPKIAALIAGCADLGWDPHYAGFFHCFNQTKFYEAHDVLEELWLKDRQSPNYSFYKGLIQLAGAFVHLQKGRLQPSAALFKLAQANLLKYGSPHDGLNVVMVLGVIEAWLGYLEGAQENPLLSHEPPKLQLAPRVD